MAKEAARATARRCPRPDWFISPTWSPTARRDRSHRQGGQNHGHHRAAVGHHCPHSEKTHSIASEGAMIVYGTGAGCRRHSGESGHRRDGVIRCPPISVKTVLAPTEFGKHEFSELDCGRHRLTEVRGHPRPHVERIAVIAGRAGSGDHLRRLVFRRAAIDAERTGGLRTSGETFLHPGDPAAGDWMTVQLLQPFPAESRGDSSTK